MTMRATVFTAMLLMSAIVQAQTLTTAQARTHDGETAAKSAPHAPPISCKTIEPDATDGVLVAPSSHKVLFENADIRVLDVTVAAHTREPWYTHARPAVMYIMTASSAKYMTPEDPYPEPSVASARFKPFVAHLDQAEALHAVENVGDSTFHGIRVEFKHPRCSLLPSQPVIVPDDSDALLAASSITHFYLKILMCAFWMFTCRRTFVSRCIPTLGPAFCTPYRVFLPEITRPLFQIRWLRIRRPPVSK